MRYPKKPSRGQITAYQRMMDDLNGITAETPRYTKNNYIEWSVYELINWSEDKGKFIQMIVTQGWLSNVEHPKDQMQNSRMRFVKQWWKDNVDTKALEKKSKKKPIFVDNQLKLF
jgi:hypothetical protein